jgi:hypothetical protein
LINFDIMSDPKLNVVVGGGSGPPVNMLEFARAILKQAKVKPVSGAVAETFKQRLAEQKVNSPAERIQNVKVRSKSAEKSRSSSSSSSGSDDDGDSGIGGSRDFEHRESNKDEKKFLRGLLKNVGLKSVNSNSLYINGEEADIDDLDNAGKEILENIGEKFDVLYNRLPPNTRKQIYERSKDMDSMFEDVRLH